MDTTETTEAKRARAAYEAGDWDALLDAAYAGGDARTERQRIEGRTLALALALGLGEV